MTADVVAMTAQLLKLVLYVAGKSTGEHLGSALVIAMISLRMKRIELVGILIEIRFNLPLLPYSFNCHIISIQQMTYLNAYCLRNQPALYVFSKLRQRIQLRAALCL